jgi:SecD/SecF fusion protein
VTLILGIVMSMFTAIFCSRAVFEIVERRRWITKLGMMRLLANTKLDFMSKWKIAAAGSLILIVAGVVATGVRGKRIFDIDLAGGTAVHVVFQREMPDEELRRYLADVLDGTNDRLQQIQDKLDARLLSDKALRSALADEQGGDLSELSDEEILPLLQQQKYGKDFTPPTGKVDWSATNMAVEGQERNTWYNINTSLQSVDYLKDVIREVFRDQQGNSLLASYSLDYDPASIVSAGPATAASGDAASGDADDHGGDEQPCGASFIVPAESDGDASTDSATADEGQVSSQADADQTELNPNGAEASTNKENGPDSAPSTGPVAPDDPATTDTNDDADTASDADVQPSDADGGASTGESGNDESGNGESGNDAPDQPTAPSSGGATRNDVTSQVTVAFGHEIHGPALAEELRAAAAAHGIDDLVLRIRPEPPQPDWTETSNVGYFQWYMELGADKEQTMAILDAVQSSLSETPVWPSSNKIGGQVAGDTQAMAVAAILASLLGIVIYLWIRFQRVSFGLAAVVALVHDVTITVGAVAVSYWLQNILGFAQVIEFKISLPVVAALLTIIGYSLNDTIVVFDRIREVRGKSRELTSDMVNRSVNQTLSRTLLTSGTTLIVVAILYFFGGEGVHGFAFALLVGIVVGTYSSIFVASPVLLWLMNRKSASTSKPAAKAAV